MPEFRFHIPIEVRYGDLDPQWHVNNARYLSFLEQARMSYLVQLGLWDGQDFNRLGLIVADIHISYLAPMVIFHKYRLDQRVARLGNKSLVFEYQIVDEDSGKQMAAAEAVMVAFDYDSHTSIPVPDTWRRKISEFEGLEAP
jgi:acyl-CoA thioester hydrolase